MVEKNSTVSITKTFKKLTQSGQVMEEMHLSVVGTDLDEVKETFDERWKNEEVPKKTD